MEVLSQFLFRLAIKVPGAFIRWMYFRGKKSFKEILTDNSAYNAILSFIVIGLVILSIILAKR